MPIKQFIITNQYSKARQYLIKKMQNKGYLLPHYSSIFGLHSLHLIDGVCCDVVPPTPENIRPEIPNRHYKFVAFTGNIITEDIFYIFDGKFVDPTKLIAEFSIEEYPILIEEFSNKSEDKNY